MRLCARRRIALHVEKKRVIEMLGINSTEELHSACALAGDRMADHGKIPGLFSKKERPARSFRRRAANPRRCA